jgi:hypothetical protein
MSPRMSIVALAAVCLLVRGAFALHPSDEDAPDGTSGRCLATSLGSSAFRIITNGSRSSEAFLEVGTLGHANGNHFIVARCASH